MFIEVTEITENAKILINVAEIIKITQDAKGQAIFTTTNSGVMNLTEAYADIIIRLSRLNLIAKEDPQDSPEAISLLKLVQALHTQADSAVQEKRHTEARLLHEKANRYLDSYRDLVKNSMCKAKCCC
jgi:hypothetical protein